MAFDINILPLNRQDGRDRPDWPGLQASAPVRKADRVRKNDRLVVLLHFEDQMVIARDQTKNLVDGIVNSYFGRPGTITSALRGVMEEINEALLEHNLGRGGGQQVVAYLSLVALKGDLLYLAQSGLTHGFLLNEKGIEHLYDAQASGRGLGLGRTTDVRFFQTELSEGTLLALTPKLPSGWNETTLKGAFGQQLGVVSRRFTSHAGMDLQALVLEARKGSGELFMLTPAAAEERPAATPEPKVETPPRTTRREAPPPEPEPGAWEPVETPSGEPKPTPVISASPMERGASRPAPSAPKTRQAPEVAEPGREAQIAEIALEWGQKISDGFGRLMRSARTLLGRVVPSEEEFTLPASIMAFIAVAVPLVVVAVAAFTYLRVGLPKQYDVYFAQAQFYLQEAQSQTDISLQREAWSNALHNVELAEQYNQTDESQALHDQAQTALDTLDKVSRLGFEEAIAGTLSPNAEIVQMVATGRELYLLDKNTGSVLRAWLTGTGYEMDPNFRCGPGGEALIVGPLIDIAPLPRTNQLVAGVLAMDGNGNLLYCAPDESPLAVPLTPPDSNWGEPIGITVENGNLYVLDPITNAIWIYFGDEGQFREAPRFFFTTEVPSLQDAIDFTMVQSDLFILHLDGHITRCTYSDLPEAPTHCDTAEFKDTRPGRQNGPMVADARFFQIQQSQSPPPAIYLLDPIARSIYRFGIQLSFDRQFRAENELPEGLITAYAISPTGPVFIAIENQIFFAFLPQ